MFRQWLWGRGWSRRRKRQLFKGSCNSNVSDYTRRYLSSGKLTHNIQPSLRFMLINGWVLPTLHFSFNFISLCISNVSPYGWDLHSNHPPFKTDTSLNGSVGLNTNHIMNSNHVPMIQIGLNCLFFLCTVFTYMLWYASLNMIKHENSGIIGLHTPRIIQIHMKCHQRSYA